jgi:hypothetical protein
MAQTTQNASVGPVFVVTSFQPSSLTHISHITDYKYYKTSVSINKIRKKKKHTNRWPKRRVLRRLGPFSSSQSSFLLSVAYLVE